MYLWEHFQQEYLDQCAVGDKLTNRSIAADCNISPTEASAWIQLYLQAQRGKNSKTKYVLHRRGRTVAAQWTIGARTQDARDRVGQFGDDVKRTIDRALVRDLVRSKKLNQRSITAVENQLEPMIDGFLHMVDAMVSAVGWSDVNGSQ